MMGTINPTSRVFLIDLLEREQEGSDNEKEGKNSHQKNQLVHRTYEILGNSKDACWQTGGRTVEGGFNLYVKAVEDKNIKFIS